MAENTAPNPNDPQEQQSMENLLNAMHSDYRQVKKSITRSILVLKDKTKGLMVKDATTKVGDRITGNVNVINIDNFCKKLEELNGLLNTTLGSIEWLLLHIEELKKVDNIMRENVQEGKLERRSEEIKLFDNTVKYVSTEKAVVSASIGGISGGVGGLLLSGAAAKGMTIKLVAIKAKLASIGMVGAAGVGTVAVAVVIGVTVGCVSVWVYNAYQIGKERKAKFEELVEMENSLDKEEVILKVMSASEDFKRIVEQVKDTIKNK